MGDGPWAHNALKKILGDNSIEVVFIMVRYDKRDEVLMNMAQEYGIPLEICENINSMQFLQRLKNYKLDLLVSMSFNQIFKSEIINIPLQKIINCHAGKLPYYRGRNILNWALINDEKEFGITVHYVDEGIDTGDIILQRCFEITDDDNYATLLDRAYVGCADVLYDSIKLIQSGKVNRIRQESIDLIGLYCGMRGPGDELLDWNQSSRDIFNFVRAVAKPGPQATNYVNGIPVYINKVRLIPDAHIYKGIPGQVIGKKNNCVWVKTLDTMIEIVEYTSDRKLKIGDRLRMEK